MATTLPKPSSMASSMFIVAQCATTPTLSKLAPLETFSQSSSECVSLSPSSSPFTDLGRDLFERILLFVAGEPPDSSTLSTNAVRFMLPFALCNTTHYHWTTRAVRSLSIYPLHFGGSARKRANFPAFPLSSNSLFPPPPPPPPPPPIFGSHSSSTFHRGFAHTVSATQLEGALRVFSNIHSLNLSMAVAVNDTALDRIVNCLPELRELRIPGNNLITPAGVAALSRCKQLTRLDLSYCLNLGDPCASTLVEMKSLHALNVARWKVSDAFVGTIAVLPNLEELNLFACMGLTRKALFLLGESAKALKMLKFRAMPEVREMRGAVEALAGCRELRELNFSLGRTLIDEDVQCLGNAEMFPSLQKVLLSQCAFLSDRCVENLSHNPNIRYLNLSHCEFLTDAAASSAAKLHRLENLDLTGCAKITDLGVKWISELPHLKVLSLARCTRITDEGAITLSEASSVPLKCVDVRHCFDITDVGLGKLAASCAELRH